MGGRMRCNNTFGHLVFGHTPVDGVRVGEVVGDGDLVGLIARRELLAHEGRVQHRRLQFLDRPVGGVRVHLLVVVPGRKKYIVLVLLGETTITVTLF